MNPVQEALRQVLEGADFEPPEKLLRNVKPEQASTVLPVAPYSIGTNVAHADHWNKIWLAQIAKEKGPNPFPDFPAVSAEEWPTVRASFLENLQRAGAIATQEAIDERTVKRLLKIAVHTSYHLGQIKLLKRELWASGKR